jgi:hypothetical protein
MARRIKEPERKSIQERFAEEYDMPARDVAKLVELAKEAFRCNELACNGDPHPLGGRGNKASNSYQWGKDVDRLTERIAALVRPYGFTEVVYTGLGPTLKRGAQYVEVPY